MITIIRNGKFTGTQYTIEQFTKEVQEFHKEDFWVDKSMFDIVPKDLGEIDFGEPTEEELAEALNIKKEIERKQRMLEGLDYKGYIISLTKDDGDGLVQVKNGFALGLTNTVIHFENGTKMPITADVFQEFASWFVNERNKFFGGT